MFSLSSSLQHRSLVLLFVSSLLFAGCRTNHHQDARSAQSTPHEAEATALPHALSAEALRHEYPGLNGGEPCIYDEQCDAPLRCITQECNFPPAMTAMTDLKTPQITIHTQKEQHAYHLELATDLDEQKRGLMHRRHMDPDFGMLFVYNDSERRSFWMKNTLIPLDIIFIKEDLTIDSIVHNAAPKTLTPRPSDGAAKYVLELVGGECERKNIREGDRVEFSRLPENL